MIRISETVRVQDASEVADARRAAQMCASALRDGFTTGSGMGLGLGGAKRLSNEFSLSTAPGEGTTVTIARWKGIT